MMEMLDRRQLWGPHGLGFRVQGLGFSFFFFFGGGEGAYDSYSLIYPKALF